MKKQQRYALLYQHFNITILTAAIKSNARYNIFDIKDFFLMLLEPQLFECDSL